MKAIPFLSLLMIFYIGTSCNNRKADGNKQPQEIKIEKPDTIGILNDSINKTDSVVGIKSKSSPYKLPSENGKMKIDANHPVQLTIKQYSIDPGRILDNGGTLSEDTIIQYNLRALNQSQINDSTLVIYDSIAGDNIVKITLINSIFDMTKYDINYNTNFINGHKSYGHDGLPSEEYVKINFHKRSSILTQINMQLNGTDIFIPKQSYRNLLRVHLNQFKCYTIDQTAIIMMAYFGGDGAGSYTCYSYYDINKQEYLGRYFDWCGYPETFCSEDIDYFSKASDKKRYYFDLIIK